MFHSFHMDPRHFLCVAAIFQCEAINIRQMTITPHARGIQLTAAFLDKTVLPFLSSLPALPCRTMLYSHCLSARLRACFCAIPVPRGDGLHLSWSCGNCVALQIRTVRTGDCTSLLLTSLYRV